jgi:acetylornithine deacetylase
MSCRAQVRGLECHSSLTPHGVNAVQAAAKAVSKLADMAARKAEEGPFDEDYDVPFSTIHCGTIRGGTAANIVPLECSFEFEFRCLPVDDAEALFAEFKDYVREEIEPAMKAIAPEAGFNWEEASFHPGLDMALDSEVVALAKALTGANTTGKVAFGTEAGLFDQGGIPTVVCGPGSIDQAHKPDEFVSLEQLALCERFMTRLLDRVSTA